MFITLTAKATSQQNHRCSHNGTDPGLAVLWKVLVEKQRLLSSCPPTSPKQINSQRWMLCYGNVKKKLLERYNHYLPSLKGIKRHLYFVLVISQPYQLPTAKQSSPLNFSCTNIPGESPVQNIQAVSEQESTPRPLLSPLSMVLQHVTWSSSLYQTFFKMLELCILFVHVKCKNIFTDVLFKHLSWVEKHVIISLNKLQQHKYVSYIHVFSHAPMLPWILGGEARAGITKNDIISNTVKAFNASSWSPTRQHNNLAIPVSLRPTVQ